MTVLPILEDVVTSLVDKIETNLSSYIAELNAAVSDGYVLEDNVQVVAYPPPLQTLSHFPTVAIQDGDTTFTDDTGWGATAHTQLTVVVFDQSSDPTELAWKMRRWNRVVASCVLADRSIGTAGWGMTLHRITPGPTLGRTENPRVWMTFSAITINIRSEQNSV